MSARRKIAVADTLMTWPGLTVAFNLLPWSWRIVPRLSTDFDCTSSWSIEWLMVKVEWFANRPMFPIERTLCPTCHGEIRETVGMVCQTCGHDYGATR